MTSVGILSLNLFYLAYLFFLIKDWDNGTYLRRGGIFRRENTEHFVLMGYRQMALWAQRQPSLAPNCSQFLGHFLWLSSTKNFLPLYSICQGTSLSWILSIDFVTAFSGKNCSVSNYSLFVPLLKNALDFYPDSSYTSTFLSPDVFNLTYVLLFVMTFAEKFVLYLVALSMTMIILLIFCFEGTWIWVLMCLKACS